MAVLTWCGAGCLLAVLWGRRELVRWEASHSEGRTADARAAGSQENPSPAGSLRAATAYLPVALVAGALALMVALRSWEVNRPLAVASLLALPWVVVLATVDLIQHRLPDLFTCRLTVTIAGSALVGELVTPETFAPELTRVLLGGAASGLCYLALAVVSGGQGMGLGDVKVAPALGAMLAWAGWEPWLIGAILPFLLGGVWGGVLLMRGRGRRARLPFGPFMFAGTYLALLG